MVGQRTGVILRQMQALLGAGTFTGLSDRQLLERFLERRDEASELAFAVLVERHGPMVLGVCRRILGDPHDAEDAFQATFLVLVATGRLDPGRGFARALALRRRHASGDAGQERRSGAAGPRAIRPRSARSRADRKPGRRTSTGPRSGDDLPRRSPRLPGRFQAPVLLCDLEGTQLRAGGAAARLAGRAR